MVSPRLGRRFRILTVVVLGLIIIAFPETASTQSPKVYLDDWWQDGVNVAWFSYDRSTIYVGDHERDGDGVYVEYRGRNGTHGFVWDGNGSQAGYGSAKVFGLTSFRLCEDDWGTNDCTNWVYV
ncbi:hypothetical protein [Sphaerobacter sp.]|uniref:hypothetical protein n=1 Tax=Sphaerobacter sp. TaxID=2099654 RepID=UPI001DD7B9BD|nr:hypothetical protein [Sphaerobacter sp.]MBX5446099.1 hypothetical protein [Sphaerobacter sp.]